MARGAAEGTEIEPSSELGTSYLELTAALVGRWRRSEPPERPTAPAWLAVTRDGEDEDDEQPGEHMAAPRQVAPADAQAWVRAAYRLALGRAADEGGLRGYTQPLQRGWAPAMLCQAR